MKTKKMKQETKMKQEMERAADPFHRPMTDPQGSYTGVPEYPEETPVQDADDL